MKTHATTSRLTLVLLALCAVASLFAAGCRSSIPEVAGSRLRYKRQAVDGSRIEVDVRSPREVRIGGITVDLTNGLLVLTNYSAIPNEAALRARVDEVTQQRQMWKDGLDTGRELGALSVLGLTGRAVPPAAVRLSPEEISQIVSQLRSNTNATATPTNLTPKTIPTP